MYGKISFSFAEVVELQKEEPERNSPSLQFEELALVRGLLEDGHPAADVLPQVGVELAVTLVQMDDLKQRPSQDHHA